jgi:protease I
MAGKLDGKTIAFLATEGVEQVELTEPWQAVEEAGGRPELVSLEEGQVQAFNHLDKANPDFLRMDEGAVAFVRSFFEQGKPVAVICHGPWTLVEAGVLRGRTITSWPSLKTDIRNAGGTWVDEEVHVDQGLVSSRKPDDLPAFCAKLVEEFCEGVHEGQRLGAGATA